MNSGPSPKLDPQRVAEALGLSLVKSGASPELDLQRVAEALGLSVDELTEAMAQQDFAMKDLEANLQRTVELLRSYKGDDAEQSAADFARAEVSFPDPLQARRVQK
jgi:phage-related minor tail protein